jgi:O-antigen ligase
MPEILPSSPPNAPRTALRADLPQQVLACLPLSLFFPVGVMYGGVLLFYISLIISGDYRQKWRRISSSAMLPPVLALSLLSIIIGVTHERPAGEFWSGFWHYQTYLFLFPFLSVGAGIWQQRAQKLFFFGALYAATLYYLNALQLLPDTTLFRSYVLYQGNKSILLGILLAIAAGWMLHAWRIKKDHAIWRALALLYVVAALLLLAKTRTASLIFILLCGMLLLRQFSFSVKRMVPALLVLLATAAGIAYVTQLPAPATCIVNDMHKDPQMHAANILLTRGICTVQQVRDFGQGKKATEDGMRLEIYKNTYELIAEKPWSGHGIANWMPQYQVKAKGMISASMTTPHNDYLLYTTELGLFGLLALLWIWAQQLWLARKMRFGAYQEQAMPLAMLSVTMIVGGMFNAILRDGVFGMAFMILLAIPLAGLARQRTEN